MQHIRASLMQHRDENSTDNFVPPLLLFNSFLVLMLPRWRCLATLFENYSKCRIWIFECWRFPPIFVLLKLTCLVILFDRKLQFFKNSPNWQFLAFLINFSHSKCKRSSLRSQCWMRLFLWFSNTVPGLAFCDRRNAMLKGLIPIKNKLGKNESPFIFYLNLLQKSVDGIWGRIWFVDPDLGLAITASRCNARIGFRVSYKVCQIHKRVNELGHFSWCEKHSFLLWERKEAKTQFTAAPVLPPSHTHKL